MAEHIYKGGEIDCLVRGLAGSCGTQRRKALGPLMQSAVLLWQNLGGIDCSGPHSYSVHSLLFLTSKWQAGGMSEMAVLPAQHISIAKGMSSMVSWFNIQFSWIWHEGDTAKDNGPNSDLFVLTGQWDKGSSVIQDFLKHIFGVQFLFKSPNSSFNSTHVPACYLPWGSPYPRMFQKCYLLPFLN